MIASARITAELDSRGVTRLTQVFSDPPLILRSTPDAVYLVGGAAGPLGGDDLTLEIEAGPGARLTIRSAAASLALPGASGATSHLKVIASVGARARLEWLPEPVIACASCRHRTHTTIALAHDSTLVWREELILGRHDEASGHLRSRIDCTVGGKPLLRNELAAGCDPGWDGPAVLGGAGAAGSILAYAPRDDFTLPVRPPGITGAYLCLEGGGVLFSARAEDAVALRCELDAALELLSLV